MGSGAKEDFEARAPSVTHFDTLGLSEPTLTLGGQILSRINRILILEQLLNSDLRFIKVFILHISMNDEWQTN